MLVSPELISIHQRFTRLNDDCYGLLATPGVDTLQNFQSLLASSVSLPLGMRHKLPSTALLSATIKIRALPSTKLTGPGKPGMMAPVMEPSYDNASIRRLLLPVSAMPSGG